MNILAGNSLGFNLTGEITKEDYDTVILPAVKDLTDQSPSHLNLMLVVDTDLSNFTAGAWMKDAVLGLKNLTKFHRVAIVSDSAVVKNVTPFADKMLPGEYRAFPMKDLDSAKTWMTEV